jgi:hypothetical protein
MDNNEHPEDDAQSCFRHGFFRFRFLLLEANGVAISLMPLSSLWISSSCSSDQKSIALFRDEFPVGLASGSGKSTGTNSARQPALFDR